MTHDEAKKSMAAEAYILDDLEAAERNAFEEHFFDCTDCTTDVLDAAKIADGIRTGTNVVPFRHHSRWAAAAAAAAVAIGLAYNYVPQVASLRHQTQPPVGQSARITVSEKVIELEATRGAAAVYHVRANQPVGIYFTIPPSDVPPPAYLCVLVDASGHVV
jgi:anti-sigma factor RsiW